MKARIIPILAFLICVTLGYAQGREDSGAIGLAQALNRLDVIESALYTGAHPDDEDSELLAWLSLGRGVRTAYLSITRGDGGQNLLGAELFEALGVIRTEELLGARRFDHAQQLFTPSVDFGFSKTADESFEKWGRQNVLGDFVRVIRLFRPEIIISAFSGTPLDGHGHHQVSGIITQEAFMAAADPNLFPQYGRPWQAKKLYMDYRQHPTGDAASVVTVNTGEFDPVAGRSYNEIAAEGRSLHRSQAQGQAQNKGPSTTRLVLVQKSPNVPDAADLYAGTLHTLPDLTRLEPALEDDLKLLEGRIEAIRQETTLIRPSTVFPDLVEALKLFQAIRAKATQENVRFLLEKKELDFHEAARLAEGLVVDVIASDDTIVPGQDLTVAVSVINGGHFELSAARTRVDLPPGWTFTAPAPTGSLAPGQKQDQVLRIKVGPNPDFTQPYWLRQPHAGDRFVWPQGSAASMPFDPMELITHTEVDFAGAHIAMVQAAQFRRVDSMYGEQRSLVNVVPALSVRLTPEIAVVPLSGDRKKEFTVTVENQNTTAAESEVRLVVPAGWVVSPASRTIGFTRQGEKISVRFAVAIPETAGDFAVQAVAKSGATEFTTGYRTVAYPHIGTHYLYGPAESKVEVFDVKARAASLGYVEGAGDSVPDALRQLGLNVTMLSSLDLAMGDLSRFSAIILGIRAYTVREDLRSANMRLLDYVNNGGTLIVQYNRKGEVGTAQYGPYPYTINDNARVTREDAAVTILDPANPVFRVPNTITRKDFDGWVQERGLYFLGQWDAKYSPLLECSDPGEEPLKGGLVIARFGKGTYIYTGYAFFRELPAGVKGAYRLFANLVSIQN